MPSLEFHRCTIDRNKKTLSRLLSFEPESSADNGWILTVVYYTALHLIDIAVDIFVEESSHVMSHADRLEYLEHMGYNRVRQIFNKMHILSEGFR